MFSEHRLVKILEGEIEVLHREYPGMSFRFCRRLGRRVAHLTGDTAILSYDELRLELGEELLLLVDGPWRDRDTELRDYASKLVARLVK